MVLKHFHKCPGCGGVWKHSDQWRGDSAAHACPHCGRADCYGYHFPSRQERLAAKNHPPSGRKRVA